ncbi:MAG: 23S rRNA (pseudouridine(1915)-N(3))-methyltransferase RlmH [Oscillatoriales cyanobacterium RM2_1_1]|nr:23S rRNA (pseudouridine(1915)-N(3))-methyltransferase RlmH [Oscillatoriales cyanobacterium SM2_3_0]NJO47474.1 23S rRNA (pseudouridine(1915)-N(3))-methyltransferase RlmH [Oscillatoriales cyanobacterium RM2_1_1]
MQGFPKIKLIAVGKVKKRWIVEGIELYQKRLPELEIVEIKDSNPISEGEQILTLLKSGDHPTVLTEEGKTCGSIEFAEFLKRSESNRLVFIIGSAEGLSARLKQAADRKLSLSPMTFPHELARLLLIEQLYRAKTILQGSSYHK